MFGDRPARKREVSEEDKIRSLMNSRKITYQEAEQMIKAGQKSIFEF